MNKEIDLGVRPEEMYGGPENLSVAMEKPSQEKIYPILRIEGPDSLELPEAGEMIIEFKRKSETSKTREDGSHWYECVLEVKCVCGVESDEPEAPSKRDTSTEDSLDALAEKVHARMRERKGNPGPSERY